MGGIIGERRSACQRNGTNSNVARHAADAFEKRPVRSVDLYIWIVGPAERARLVREITSAPSSRVGQAR
ncbi:MAG: hypothetical protein D6705_11945 [Deltaproteobacteria bacterium]|nr:MAG: hypothetical protein D6705_11945 [Deltaproteobacteria bacterium]